MATKTKPRKAVDRITPFVEAYITNGSNASKAALAAGFSPGGAGVAGHRMLKNAKVLALIDKRQAEIAEENSITLKAVLKSLEQALLFDPRKLYNADGTMKAIVDLDDDAAQALAGIEVVEKGTISEVDGKMTLHPYFTKKVKWLDKNAARDQAARILGAYGRDNAQPGAGIAAALEKQTKGLDDVRAKFRAVLAAGSPAP